MRILCEVGTIIISISHEETETEKLSNLPKVIYLVNGEPTFESQPHSSALCHNNKITEIDNLMKKGLFWLMVS
jgi:hypothetical protein